LKIRPLVQGLGFETCCDDCPPEDLWDVRVPVNVIPENSWEKDEGGRMQHAV
jgi:hypothetical protein